MNPHAHNHNGHISHMHPALVITQIFHLITWQRANGKGKKGKGHVLL